MLKVFVINEDGRANLEVNLKGEPVFKVKANLNPASIKNIAQQQKKYQEKLAVWQSRLNNYAVIGWKKDSGINTGKDIIGKRCEGELTAGTVFIHKLLQ